MQLQVSQDDARLMLWKRAWNAFQLIAATVLVAVAYYAGTWLGHALVFPQTTIILIWPPNAILLAVLLLTPTQRWPWWLFAAATTHLLIYTPLGVPFWQQAIQIGHSLAVVLVVASILRRFAPDAQWFATLRGVRVFLGTVASVTMIAAVGSSAVAVAFGLAGDFWQMWAQSSLSNMLACLTILPAMLMLAHNGPAWLAESSRTRILEAVTLGLLLFCSGAIVFGLLKAGPASGTLIRFGILPLLLWTAVRLGPGGFSLALTLVMYVAIWNMSLGNGPYVRASPEQNVLNMQSEFLAFAAPLLLLAALIAQHRRDQATLLQLNSQLEDRVAARTAELARTNADLAITKTMPKLRAAIERRAEQLRQAGEAAAWRAVAEVVGKVQPGDTAVVAAAEVKVARYRTVGRLQIDTQRRELWFDTQRISVTPIEYTIMASLAETAGAVFSYGELVQRTHAIALSEREAYGLLRTHVRNLRHKIERSYLVSVRGVGYMLDATGDATSGVQN